MFQCFVQTEASTETTESQFGSTAVLNYLPHNEQQSFILNSSNNNSNTFYEIDCANKHQAKYSINNVISQKSENSEILSSSSVSYNVPNISNNYQQQQLDKLFSNKAYNVRQPPTRLVTSQKENPPNLPGLILLPENPNFNNNNMNNYVLNNVTNNLPSSQSNFIKNCNSDSYSFVKLINENIQNEEQNNVQNNQEYNNLNESSLLSQQLQLLLAQKQQHQQVLLEQQQQVLLEQQHQQHNLMEQQILEQQQQQNLLREQQHQQKLLLHNSNEQSCITYPQEQHITEPPKYTMPDLLRRKLIQQQLILLLHANKCQKRDMANEGVTKCHITHCKTMKSVLKHLISCQMGRECTGRCLYLINFIYTF